jgi:hypothetical protein
MEGVDMALTKKSKSSTQSKEETPKVQDRALGGLKVRMCCLNEKNEWNFKATSPPNAIDEGKRICQENGFRFPQDVVIWDFT